MNSQIKKGAFYSYIAIFFNMAAGLIYTPWMISQIGQSNYGLYTLASSLISMFVMDFGMSAAVSRFVSKYNAEGNQKKVNDFLGLVYKLYLLIDFIILFIIIILWFFIENIYQQLDATELSVFKSLYLVVGFFTVLSFPFTNLNGIMTAYEKFSQMKLCDLFHKAFIVFAMVFALLMGQGVFALVVVNAIAGILTIIFKLIVISRETPVQVNFTFFDKKLLKEIFGFSVWTTVSTLAQRLIFNITPTIIAAISITGSAGVAVFGLASTLEGYVYTFATAINGMFLPRISKIVAMGKKKDDLLPLMVKVGRVQLYIVGIITVGFIAVGKSFIVDIWGRVDYEQSYWCAVLLIIPSLFYLPMQIANTTVVVENKVRLQAIVFCIMGLVNVCASIFLTRFLGALGAALSIFIAYMVRNILMIIVYIRVLKLEMWEFFKESYGKLMPLLVIVLIAGSLCQQMNSFGSVYIRFIINVCAIMVIFISLSWKFFMNTYEKQLFTEIIKKLQKNK